MSLKIKHFVCIYNYCSLRWCNAMTIWGFSLTLRQAGDCFCTDIFLLGLFFGIIGFYGWLNMMSYPEKVPGEWFWNWFKWFSASFYSWGEYRDISRLAQGHTALSVKSESRSRLLTPSFLFCSYLVWKVELNRKKKSFRSQNLSMNNSGNNDNSGLRFRCSLCSSLSGWILTSTKEVDIILPSVHHVKQLRLNEDKKSSQGHKAKQAAWLHPQSSSSCCMPSVYSWGGG